MEAKTKKGMNWSEHACCVALGTLICGGWKGGAEFTERRLSVRRDLSSPRELKGP